jgi:hypothetical protein
MSLPHLLIVAGSLYLGAGTIVALLFAFGLVARVEPTAHGASFLFRLLIVPGAALLWPVVAVRSLRALRSGV